MKSKITALLIATAFGLGLWSCEDLPPQSALSGGPGALSKKVRITGSVLDVASLMPIFNATVFRNSNGAVDSVHTDANGAFSFEYDQAGDSVLTTISLRKRGYLDNSYTFLMIANTQIALNLRMTADLSTSAVLEGVVRDSATLYPLRGASVIFSVPGFSDQLETSIDGAFTFSVDLIDRDSLPVTVTVSKTGFKSRQLVKVVHTGQTSNLGNVLMRVDQGSSAGQVLGRVYDNQSRQPIVNASVLLTSSLVTDSLLTTGDGAYSFSVDLKGLSTLAAGLKVTKNGYRSQNLNVNFNAGAATYQDVFLDRDTTTGVRRDSGTGLAHSIALISVSTNQISVYGVGGVESSIIIFEVRDSLGFPIDIDHRDTVQFTIQGTPLAGGAYVSPATVITNVSGRVATIINSGTVSGVIQLVASLHRESDNVTIGSEPVLITVNAGLPEQRHFSIGPERYNFPGYDWVNRTEGILVQVGDIYSNPVRPGTAVYFNTTGGIIDASGFTDPAGHASVTLYSGNPRPVDPVYGKGFARIRAFTLGQNSITVADSALILFSGRPRLLLIPPFPPPMPDSFEVPGHGESGFIHFSVSDTNGNPLAAGTRIQVTLQYTPPPLSDYNFRVTGDVDVTLDDIQGRGPGATQFSFEVVDQTIGPTVRIPASVIIHVSGPNVTSSSGEVSLTVSGHMGG